MVTWVTPLLSPVLAAHEPDCLRKAVGQRRQLGSAMRQTFDGLQLLRGSGGDGFGFLRRGVGTRLGLLERLMDSGRPLPDAMRQLREIGRASCREKRVDLGGRRIIKKKKRGTTCGRGDSKEY